MASLQVDIVQENFTYYHAERVEQGAFAVGAKAMGTLLRSCVCIGFYHPERAIGAISHITGFGEGPAVSAADALAAMAEGLGRLGIAPGECTCFVVGGSERMRGLYQDAVSAVAKLGLSHCEPDVLGAYHRKIMLDPASGLLTIYRKAALGEMRAGGAARVHTPDNSLARFQEPRNRLATGATVLFRNARLLAFVRDQVTPAVLRLGKRYHVWCAGCSDGMEVYSIALVILNALGRRADSADFRILGTDISNEALARCRDAVYPIGERAAREHAGLLASFTTRRSDGAIAMNDLVRRKAVFKQRDIRAGSRAHRFELIVCDHVLQYFPEDTQHAFLHPLVSALAPHGFLYLSTPTRGIHEALRETHGLHEWAPNCYGREQPH